MGSIWTIARTTVGDSIRRRVILVFQLVALLMLGLAILLQYYAAGRNELFTPYQMIIILVFGGMISITTSVFLVPTEIETRTVYGVLSKPVQRSQFFLGKFLGGLLTTTLMVSVMIGVLIIGLAVFIAMPSNPDFASEVNPGTLAQQILAIIQGGVMILLQLGVLTALATSLSLVLTPTVNFAMSTFIWIVGSLQWVILALANRNEQGFVLIPWILKSVYYITPHFEDLNFLAGLTRPEVAPKVSVLTFASQISAYHLLYATIVLLIGVMLFEKKEF